MAPIRGDLCSLIGFLFSTGTETKLGFSADGRAADASACPQRAALETSGCLAWHLWVGRLEGNNCFLGRHDVMDLLKTNLFKHVTTQDINSPKVVDQAVQEKKQI